MCIKNRLVPPALRQPTSSLNPNNLQCLCKKEPPSCGTLLMKCFEKLVLKHVKDNIPASLDPLPCAQSWNLKKKVCRNSVFSVDFSELDTVSLSSTLCKCIEDFLMKRTHTVQIGSHASSIPWLIRGENNAIQSLQSVHNGWLCCGQLFHFGT